MKLMFQMMTAMLIGAALVSGCSHKEEATAPEKPVAPPVVAPAPVPPPPPKEEPGGWVPPPADAPTPAPTPAAK